nr:hypothetical protein [Tanacetum cinerariifolium]GFA69877.1 hypothetical protein [Tanacetum cinerariifolium]
MSYSVPIQYLVPPGKQRPKNTKSDTSASTGGSQSSQFGEFVSHELRLKREAAEKAFEVLKDKDETIKSAVGIFARRNLCSPKLLARRNLWTRSCRQLC